MRSVNKQRVNKKLGGVTGKGFMPGQSGNPNGRPPKNKCITSLVKELLELDAGKGKTHGQLVAEAMVTLAKETRFKGNVSAIKELLDRVEGPVTLQIGGDADSPVKVLVMTEVTRPEEIEGEVKEDV